MAEDWFTDDGDDWEAGFESERRVVVSRLGPFLRIFPRPERYVPRLHHRTYPLEIVDWAVPIEPLQLGALCTIHTRLAVRFQATVQYARDNLEHLEELAQQIQRGHLGLLQDLAEQELRRMEWDTSWLERGCEAMERRIEQGVNERLAIRNIQCRTRCALHPSFGDLKQITAENIAPWSRHRALYLELMRRRTQAEEEHLRNFTEQTRINRQREIEAETELLEVERRRLELTKARQMAEIESLKAELAADELRQGEQRETELRLRKEQIGHTAHIRKLEMEADLEEKNRRAETMNEMEHHLKREIELLAMERQRLLLEEEIREVKVAKAKGWVINAKRRFPLGSNAEPPPDEAAEIVSKPPAPAD